MLKYDIIGVDVIHLNIDHVISQIQSRIKKRSNKIAKLNQFKINRQASNLLGEEQRYDKELMHSFCLYRRVILGYVSL